MRLAVNSANKLPERLDEQALALLCKAAADPLRIDIVRALRRDSFGVQELARIFAMPQPGMSHHLKVLAKSGLLTTKREGNSVFYRRALVSAVPRFAELQASLFAAIDSCPLPDEITGRIEAVHGERAQQARQFFARNADKFAEHQAQLCELEQYRANLEDVLDLIPEPKQATVLEVGPGHGALLDVLARRFAQVVAIDSSDEMLRVARSRGTKPRTNIEYVHGSLENYPAQAGRFSAVVLNMVLHHMPSPASVFLDLARLLPAHGRLIVADLCAHEQEWAQTSCGDLWLGFAPEEIDAWASQANFATVQSQYIGLKNGFQIQLKLFERL